MNDRAFGDFSDQVANGGENDRAFSLPGLKEVAAFLGLKDIKIK
jgi:hypothetical protein